ncbi:NAD(P)-dependent oxidoreductase [Candidatus Thioglobus sp.]|nr:NAD(P)-dependent oxidoreductase [Candidatus Thioglobus sp.]
MRVFITGGAGVCGTVLSELPYEKIFFDKCSRPNLLKKEFYLQGDLNNHSNLKKHIKGCDTLIHLAASDYYPDFDMGPKFSWSNYQKNNIESVKALFDTAIKLGVNKIIFASTHRVMGMYESEFAPKIYQKNHNIMIDHLAPPRPDSLYAVSKLFGENLGRLLADENKCSFQVMRICSVRSESEDHPFAYAEKGVKQKLWSRKSLKYQQQLDRLRCLWQSRRDFLNMTTMLLQKELTGFDIFYGVSNNSRRWFDIKHAEDKLDYKPMDNSENIIKPPLIK